MNSEPEYCLSYIQEVICVGRHHEEKKARPDCCLEQNQKQNGPQEQTQEKR